MRTPGTFSLFAALLGMRVASLAACVAVEGDRILARDLAPAVPALAALPPETDLGYAPSPGAVRRFSPDELRRLLRGAAAPGGGPLCVVRATSPLTPERLLPLLRQALQDPNAAIEILDYSRAPLPAGEIEFPLSGLAATAAPACLWRGRLREPGGRSIPLWAKVRVAVRRDVLVAAEDIAAQQPIEAGQVRVESREVSPRARAGLSSPEQAAGRLARRAISRGQVVSAELLSRRRDVERGDSVRLESEAGGARLEAEAKAETSGSAGDGILVRNLATGKRVRARVVRKGLVRVDAS